MENRIKFRGLTINRIWVYGYYFKSKSNCYIIEENGDKHIVFEYSVSQFTCKMDRVGAELYHKDICKIHFFHTQTLEPVVGVVEWTNRAGFSIVSEGGECYSINFKSGGNFGDYPAVEKIGNVFEHRHLIENK